MDPPTLVERVQDLNDVELAALLCLVAGQHCIIQTEPESLDDLEQELRLVRAQPGLGGHTDNRGRWPLMYLGLIMLCFTVRRVQLWKISAVVF